MANGNSIHDEIKEQNKKFGTLTLGEKIRYIWEYYRVPIISVILIVIVVASFVNAFIRNNYDNVCYIAVCDGKITDHADNRDVLSTGFTEYIGIDGRKKRIDLDYSYNLIEQDMDQDPAISANKIYILASAREIDGYMAEKEYIDLFSTKKEAFLYDLNELFSEKEMEFLRDYLIYFTTGEGHTIPIAVDLSKASKIQSSDLTLKNPCYGIVFTSKHPDNAADFVRFVFDMDKRPASEKEDL